MFETQLDAIWLLVHLYGSFLKIRFPLSMLKPTFGARHKNVVRLFITFERSIWRFSSIFNTMDELYIGIEIQIIWSKSFFHHSRLNRSSNKPTNAIATQPTLIIFISGLASPKSLVASKKVIDIDKPPNGGIFLSDNLLSLKFFIIIFLPLVRLWTKYVKK